MLTRAYLPLTVLAAGLMVIPGHAQAPACPHPGPPWPESYVRHTGEVRVPVLLVKFQGTAGPPFTPDKLEKHLFDQATGSNTMTNYFKENSYDQFILRGDIHDWVALPQGHSYYDAGCRGIRCMDGMKRIRELINEAVKQSRSGGVDFSRYDNDGPDGQPDSGDDDGMVDLLLVVHSDRSGECLLPSGTLTPGIVPHEQKYWNLFQSDPCVLDTGSTGRSGRRVFVNEFIIVGGQSCDLSGLSPIGDYAHEIGHALGLPDLVDQDYSSNGIGYWSLMAEGGAGADGQTPESPTHLSVWAKERLGWLQPQKITAPGDYRLKPVESSPMAFRVPFFDGVQQQEYLLEVRSKTGFDVNIPAPGLVLWRINKTVVAEWDRARLWNLDLASVNDEDTRKGVALIAADGSIRGADAGDPFPGTSSTPKNFEYDSTPRSFGDVALCDIELDGDDIKFRLAATGDC